MKRSLFIFLVLLGIAAAILLPAHSSATRPGGQSNETVKRQRPAFVPGEALVRFKPNRASEGQIILNVTTRGSAAAMPADQDQHPVAVQVERFEGSDIVTGLRVARMAPEETLQTIAALNARDDVAYAEPNYLRHLDVTPNDPSYSQLYAMPLIGAPQAWDTTRGSRSIVVAVIDTGIERSHPDLQANIWTNPSPGSISGISGDVNGYDFRDNTGNITPEFHATHVAGTIGAVGDNSVGVAGVNWQVSLMSLRFISAALDSGSSADSIKAYNYVKQMKDLWASSHNTQGADIRVVNASYSGGGYSQAEFDAINAMGQSGVLFVAAAANYPDTSPIDNDISPVYPSGYGLPNVMSIAATDGSDGLAFFSHYGAHSVLMAAPGSGILSTTVNSGYVLSSGTSMATPHVTGAAALLCASNPNLSATRLRALLAFNGDILPSLQGKTLSGRRLNVFKSLQAMNENDTTTPGTVTNFQIASQNGRSINVSWIASGDDGAAGTASLYDISFIDQNTNAVIPLTGVVPAASGTAQSINFNLPYRHTGGTIRLREFDNVGNEGTPTTTPVTIPLSAADPYVPTLNSPAPLTTGGTALGLNSDDSYRQNYPLPFTFPFYGEPYNSVTISTNGNLYFSPPPFRKNGEADEVPSSVSDLSARKVISGMWDDLDLSRGNGADVYAVVAPDSSRITFRWQGVQYGNGNPIHFEIELKNDGTITTRYGDGNVNLLPVVGISGGVPDAYVIDALTSEFSPRTLTNAQSAVFTPRSSCAYSFSPTSRNFSFTGGTATIAVTTQGSCPWIATSNASWITINNGTGTGNGTVGYTVAKNTVALPRTGSITIGGLNYPVTQDAGSATIAFSSTAPGNNENNAQIVLAVTRSGDLSDVSTVDFSTSDSAGAQPCSVINGKASARCDYESVATKVVFAPNESLKTIPISVVNDTYKEGTETFTATLANPTGAVLQASQPTLSVPVSIIDNDSADGPNPLSDASFFVRQHYIDFLNREPDASGLAFWTDQTTNCGASDLTVCRVNVSGAFFLSIEFQQTGYLVEKIYKAAFGDNYNGSSTLGGTVHSLRVPVVRLDQFLPDTQRIGRGVIVNQGNWQQQLEDNKAAFTEEFVQRPAFLSAFPLSMTAAQFVDRLNDNARDNNDVRPLSQARRDMLVSGISNGSLSRAQALRLVAEDINLNNSEKNRAFVLMQYFGYLRRNPNDPQDNDYTGYEFWLNKLNAANGDYVAAEMVKAFLAATEYNQRFAP